MPAMSLNALSWEQEKQDLLRYKGFIHGSQYWIIWANYEAVRQEPYGRYVED